MRLSSLCSAVLLLLFLMFVATDARADGPPAKAAEKSARAKRGKKKAPPAAPAPPAATPAASPAPAPAPAEAPLPPTPTPASTTTTTSASLPTVGPAAAPPNPDAVTLRSARKLKPLQLDLRATANSDVLLAYIGVGANVDLGLIPIGPGTLGVGAGFEYNFCGSICWFFSAVTPLSFSQYQIAPAVRATYHLGLQKNLDLYPLAFGGPVFARAKIELDDGSASYVGSDTGVQVGVGVGLSYFVAESFFVGFEARYRYARGTYAYEIQTGNGRAVYEGSGGSWSLSGFNVMFALGYRL